MASTVMVTVTGTIVVVEVKAEVEAALVEEAVATAVVVVLVPGTKGVPLTWVKSIQEVVVKKFASSNWTAPVLLSWVANEARDVVLDPGPELPYSAKVTPSVWGLEVDHWFHPAASIQESR